MSRPSDVDRTKAKFKSRQCDRVNRAAAVTAQDLRNQVNRNFDVKHRFFLSGVRVATYQHDGDQCSAEVFLSPVLASHASTSTIEGDPYLWVLLPEGEASGFKRIGPGNTWTWNALKATYRGRIRTQRMKDGFLVLIRTGRQEVPIYAVKRQIETKQRIDFEAAIRKGAEILND